ncbi:MAG TPA: transposase [Jiangellales bacterium]|nr:transposase [Jiangellales bacterium]
MAGGRRRFSDVEKRRAVDMILGEGRTAAAVSSELGVSTASLRRWVRAHRAREWAGRVADHFGWLEQRGFTVIETDASWFWAWTVVYRRLSAAILVIQNREYGCVDVQLVRAAANAPLARRWIRVDGEVTGMAYASKLIWLRASDPEEMLDRIDGLGLTPPELDTQLAFWAAVLQTYGQDFLAGDLGVLDQPDPVVRHRRRKWRRA